MVQAADTSLLREAADKSRFTSLRGARVGASEGRWHSLHHPRPELSILAALNAGPARIHGCTLGRIAAIDESQRRSGAQSRHRRSSARAITSLPTPPSRPTNCPENRDPQAHGVQNILPFRAPRFNRARHAAAAAAATAAALTFTSCRVLTLPPPARSPVA